MSHGQANAEISVGFAPTLNCNHEQPIVLNGNIPCAPIPFDTTQITSPKNGCNPKPNAPCHPLARGAHAPAIAFSVKDDGRGAGETSPTICNQHTGVGIAHAMQVRRLTPLECERLQGFPDQYTNIPGASDTARYKALGNSMACNVMQLLGQRIAMVDAP